VLGAVACHRMHEHWGMRGRVLMLAAIPLILLEAYVVNFPGGAPAPAMIPKIYRQVARLPPGALVSLPDYAGTDAWFLEANYQFFSTAHWRPIANGYSRVEPPGFRALMDRLKLFPAPVALSAMREVKIAYIVVHAAAMPNGRSIVAAALAEPGIRLIARDQEDYLFQLTM
jgi:hypothetical protein